MNFKLFCIISFFLLNIFIHSLVENPNIKVPDFRWIKTTCNPTYSYWSNELNNVRYHDIKVSPYMENRECWVFMNDIQFSKPYLPYEILVCMDIFVFSVELFLF